MRKGGECDGAIEHHRGRARHVRGQESEDAGKGDRRDRESREPAGQPQHDALHHELAHQPAP